VRNAELASPLRGKELRTPKEVPAMPIRQSTLSGRMNPSRTLSHRRLGCTECRFRVNATVLIRKPKIPKGNLDSGDSPFRYPWFPSSYSFCLHRCLATLSSGGMVNQQELEVGGTGLF
jgi:hypothetical protein